MGVDLALTIVYIRFTPTANSKKEDTTMRMYIVVNDFDTEEPPLITHNLAEARAYMQAGATDVASKDPAVDDIDEIEFVTKGGRDGQGMMFGYKVDGLGSNLYIYRLFKVDMKWEVAA